jgi:hypothetical protein
MAAGEAEREPPLFLGPLPIVAQTFYTKAACWSLALVLNEMTGFVIEVAYGPKGPRHAYVVNDDLDAALDALGRRTLAQARAGSSRTQRFDRAAFVAMLAEDVPPAAEFVAWMQRDEQDVLVRRAASVVRDASGVTAH